MNLNTLQDFDTGGTTALATPQTPLLNLLDSLASEVAASIFPKCRYRRF